MEQQHYPELKVYGIPARTHESYKNIAARKGVTLSRVLAPKLTAIVKKYESLLTAEPCDSSFQFKIRGVSSTTAASLDRIAANLGVDRSDLIKMELNTDLSGYPAAMKAKMAG